MIFTTIINCILMINIKIFRILILMLKLDQRLPNPLTRIYNEGGQGTVEFALVALLLLVLTFGTIDLGRALYARNILQAAAQEGARKGLVDPGAAEGAAKSKLIGLDLDHVAVNVNAGADLVVVRVNYNFEFVTPLIALAELVGTDHLSLQASASMVP
jgi:TadE-like protein